MENKEFHCVDVEENYPESACKFQLIQNGVKSTYQYAIFNLERKAIGIIDGLVTNGHITLEDLSYYLSLKIDNKFDIEAFRNFSDSSIFK